MLRIEGQIATCLREARELGVSIDTAQSHLSNADASFAAIEGWFNEYRATSSDPLKRENTRGSILNGGAALAATYVNAVTQSTSAEATKMIAQSIVRALNAAILRRICFWNGTPGPGEGCGTFGALEPQPDTKSWQERDRVIVPLLDAYARAVTKAGGPTRALANADGEGFLAAILRPAANLKTWIDGQFGHYQATDWSDGLKRGNTRGSMLGAGREMVAGLRDVLTQASSFGSVTSLRAVSALTLAALNASIDRWACFFTGGHGCGTMGENEPQPDVKAAQEMADVATPLMALYVQVVQVANALATRGVTTTTGRVAGFDTTVPMIDPLIKAKLRVCKTMNDAIGVQFGHMKATNYIDFFKRSNTRGWMLATGSALATCLQQTLDTAVNAAKPVAPRGVGGLLGLGGYVSSGLGQTTAPFMMMMPLTTAPLTMLRPAATAPVVVPPVDLSPLVRSIATVAATALNAAVDRKMCYLHDAPGCGRSGVSEDHGFDKASQEQARVIAPLVVVLKNMALAVPGSAAGSLAGAFGREAKAEQQFIDGQFGHYKATDYADWHRRDNTRKAMVAAGQRMVAALRNAAAIGSTKVPLQTIARAALAASREREACYRSGAGGCDQQFGLFFEGSGADKANQEMNEIAMPLTFLLADKSAAGLGGLGEDPPQLSPAAWVGIVVVGGAVLYSALQSVQAPLQKNSRRRRSSRRTSRRAA
jgi:hypothetical protein